MRRRGGDVGDTLVVPALLALLTLVVPLQGPLPKPSVLLPLLLSPSACELEAQAAQEQLPVDAPEVVLIEASLRPCAPTGRPTGAAKPFASTPSARSSDGSLASTLPGLFIVSVFDDS